MTAPRCPTIHDHPLAYVQRLTPRSLQDVDLVVIHCTELPDLAMARTFGERVLYDSGTGNSGHYYIDRDGSCHQYVPLERCAHHVRGYNERSVGIELVNRGRWPNWFDSTQQQMDEPYTAAQIDTLIALLQWLPTQLPALHWIAGHDALDLAREAASDLPGATVSRKLDPGPLFPWQEVLAATHLQRLPADQAPGR